MENADSRKNTAQVAQIYVRVSVETKVKGWQTSVRCCGR